MGSYRTSSSSDASGTSIVAAVEPRLVLCGEIDLNTVDELVEALAAHSEPVTIIDMSRVSFIDSTGVRALVAHQTAGRRVLVTASSTPVRRILELTGLSELLDGGVSGGS